MASTGGGAARSSKKKSPDVADQDESSATELVGAGGTTGAVDAIDRKLDVLVTTISALVNSVNKLVENVETKEVKEEKVIDKAKASVDKSVKKRRDSSKMSENFIPDVNEIARLAYSNSFTDKMIKRNENDIGPYMVANELKGDKKIHGLEIVNSLRTAYKFHEEFYQSSYIQQKLPSLEKFNKSMRHFIYKSPYYRVIEDVLDMNEMSNDAILHIIRLSVMSKSRKETYDFLDSIKFPEASGDGNIMERYSDCFLDYIMAHSIAYLLILVLVLEVAQNSP